MAMQWSNWRTMLRALGVVLIGLSGCLSVGPASASSSGVVISQVFGGGGNSGAPYLNDYVELYNGGAATVSLVGWSLQYTSAAGTSWGSQKVGLGGSLAPGQYMLIQLGSGGATGAALPVAAFSGSFNMSATAGKLALLSSTTSLPAAVCPSDPAIVDLVGYGASANCAEGSTAPAPSNTAALFRGADGCTDTDNNAGDFTSGVPAPRNAASPGGSCGAPPAAPVIVSCPSSLSVASGAVVDFALTASDADSTVVAAAIQSGAAPGIALTQFHAAAGPGAAASVRLSLAASLGAGTYPVVVNFDNDASQSASCSIALTVGPVSSSFTPIYTLQGSGATTTMPGVRTTRGVVTRVNNNGYFMQDATGDGNPLTSDGIFVFTSSAPGVAVGHEVQVTGTLSEFNTGAAGNALTAANPVTELGGVSNTVFTGTGSITPTVISLPIAAQGDLERYEGMLVRIDTPLTASQNYFQGRYGQVTLSANGRLVKPTNLYRPGSALAVSQQDLNARSSVMLDDGSSQQNPDPTPYIGADSTLRAGDTLPTGVVGVIDYGLATSDNTGPAMYRIHPTETPVFVRSNPRTAAPPPLGGNVKVASFNVLNFFTTFGDGTTAAGGTGAGCAPGGTTSDCRGADNLAEFSRQRAKIVQAMAAIGADVFGLMEIQNNGNVAAQNLADALNAVVGAGTYAVVPSPPTTGTDAIRVAMLYKPASLSLAGSPMSDANPVHNRPPFAQTFSAQGQKFSVIVNHFKSKGSCPASGADADQGDGQGCFNDRRRQQATALLSFIGGVQSAAADNDVIVIGDLNAYGQEDPVEVLTSGGLVNQVALADPAGYSYVFDGEAGYLDHALATASLSAQVAGTVHWHINADEPSVIDYNTEFKQPACAACGPDYYSASPYRASDHDPVIIGLALSGGTAQTISFAALGDQPLSGGGFALSATASSGLAVSFSSSTPAVCAVTPGGSLTLLAVGTCSIDANQPGDPSYAPAPTVSRAFAVTAGAASQTISFGPIGDRAVDSGALQLVATASSGLPVSFASLSLSVCTVSGDLVTLIAQGTCTITADQPGDGGHLPAPQVQQSFLVNAPGTGSGDADVPTLPEWATIFMALFLLTLGAMRGKNDRRR